MREAKGAKVTLAHSGVCRCCKCIPIDPEKPGLGRALLLLLQGALIMVVAPVLIKVL